jgi:Yip1 domain
VQREWWARALLVLWRPNEVFAALRSTDEEDEDARSEPLLATVFLAGIAVVLGTNAFAHALDDFELDGLTLAVIGFIAGGIYGLVAYFLLGFLAYAGARAAGSTAPAVHLRQVVGFAAVPLAVSLVAVWPVRLAIYGSDVFETGGSDTGFGNHVFEALELGAIVWSLALVVVGLRAYHAWSIGRAFLASLPVLLGPLFALARAYSVL